MYMPEKPCGVVHCFMQDTVIACTLYLLNFWTWIDSLALARVIAKNSIMSTVKSSNLHSHALHCIIIKIYRCSGQLLGTY